ncbi:MAG: hypothetical protein M3Z66_21425 [Chloroflexota bacterium]|nr:hypothetical protein [Chloroflexota bacterium]
MGTRRLICALSLLALSPGFVVASHATPGHHRIGLMLYDDVPLYSAASPRAHVISILMQQSQVVELKHSHAWMEVRAWASVRGWVPAKDVVFRAPWVTVSTYRAPAIRYPVHAYAARPLHTLGAVTLGTDLRLRPNGPIAGWLPMGRTVTVSSWQQDASGGIWYRVGRWWVSGGAVRFLTPNPASVGSDGQPLWKIVAGKGMWLTLGTVAVSDPEAIVQAAHHDGITHLYLESAISPLGFHGRGSVGPLIEAAHRGRITVIAWVYPYLYDIAGDVTLTRAVAAYRTPSGQRFDGIAADLERNITPTTVREYSQLIRAYVGPRYLLVGVTYPPQSLPSYPFAEVAHQYNVIAPMDYWHQTKTAYGLNYNHMRYSSAYTYRYAAESVATIRADGGIVPIEPIGQTFDNYGRLGMGPLAPSEEEERGFVLGSKAAGAIGVSFFQWMTAGVGEWRAIHNLRF